jgi:hypothetical protein
MGGGKLRGSPACVRDGFLGLGLHLLAMGLIRPWNRLKSDAQPVPAVDQADRDGQVGEFLGLKLLHRVSVSVVRHMVYAN